MVASSDLAGDLYTAFPNSFSTLVSLLSVFTQPLRYKLNNLTGNGVYQSGYGP